MDRGASNGTGDTFGARLRRYRKAAGLTQEELAARAGLSAKAISALERGARRRPYPHTVRSLAEALGLPEGGHAPLLSGLPDRSDAVPDALPGSALPMPPTPLLGRERELDETGSLLLGPGVRLLTLTGVGGIGKTRLALEVARTSGTVFPDGVGFVALAPLGDATLVAPAIAQALGLEDTGRFSPFDAVRQYLREREMLLLLDNFEHVPEAAPEVATLIEECPDLTVLVTSRAPLRIRSEQEYPVPPLGLPVSTLSPEPCEILASPSGRLFSDRARAASPTFEITADNAGAIAAICWRLDGLPLALELVAARVRFLDSASLLDRLDRALSAGWARDVPERQRTMHSTLDWSHDLLSEDEKILFRRLSVFSGGFALEAAEDVGAEPGADDHPEGDVPELLGRLVEQSLILAEVSAGGMRYRMLEPVRQYALERLKESGEEDRVVRRHAAHYAALAERAEPEIKGWNQPAWLDRLEVENGNLQAAIVRSVAADDIETASRIGWAIAMYWVMRARHGEGRLLMGQVLDHAGGAPAGLRARASWPLAVCVYGSEDNERLAAISEEAAVLARQAGDERVEANLVGMTGFAALQLGDPERATRFLEEALRTFRRLDLNWDAAHILNHLAVTPMRRGEYEKAAGYAREALEIAQRIGDRLAGGIALYTLAQAAWETGDQEDAYRYFRESLKVSHELADRVNSAYSIRAVAAVETLDEPRRTALLLGAAEGLLEAAGIPTYATSDNELHLHAVQTTREILGEEAWSMAYAEGRSMTLDETVAFALDEVSDPKRSNRGRPSHT